MKDSISSAFDQIRADNTLIEKTSAHLNRQLALRPDRQDGRRWYRTAAVMAASAAIALCVCAYSFVFSAYVHVSIDVNPSVELTLNRLGMVIDTFGFNRDGEYILQSANLMGRMYDDAALILISLIEEEGYFENDALVSVTVQAPSSYTQQRLLDRLHGIVKERVSSLSTSTEVEVFDVSADVWSHAHSSHMSPAKYLAVQELILVDSSVTPEAYSGASIRQIRQRTQECRSAHSAAGSGTVSDTGGRTKHGHHHSGG